MASEDKDMAAIHLETQDVAAIKSSTPSTTTVTPRGSLRTLLMETNRLTPLPLQPLPAVHPEGIQDGKKRMLALDS